MNSVNVYMYVWMLTDRPVNADQQERTLLTGVFIVRKGKTQLHKWAERQVILCGTCLIVASVKDSLTGKMHILPLVGGKVRHLPWSYLVCSRYDASKTEATVKLFDQCIRFEFCMLYFSFFYWTSASTFCLILIELCFLFCLKFSMKSQTIKHSLEQDLQNVAFLRKMWNPKTKLKTHTSRVSRVPNIFSNEVSDAFLGPHTERRWCKVTMPQLWIMSGPNSPIHISYESAGIE